MFDDTKYKVEDLSHGNKNPMPCRFRITSDRKTSHAKELIDVVMAGFGMDRVLTYAPQDYTLPYKSTEALVKRRLIKVLGDSIPDFERRTRSRGEAHSLQPQLRGADYPMRRRAERVLLHAQKLHTRA